VAFAGLAEASGGKNSRPPARPAEFGRGRPTPKVAPAAPAPAPAAPTAAAPASTAPAAPSPAAADCLAQLRADGAEVEPAAQPPSSDGACSVENPVRLLSVADPSDAGRRIAFPGKPLVACRVALPIAQWTARLIAPVLKAELGSPLRALQTGPGFECRGRNRQAGGKMSAHALGLALDVMGFDLVDGRTLLVKTIGQDRAAERSFSTIRTAACGWFTTVLGPGSDAFHDDHLHLDFQLRGSSDRYRICQ
jgi:hypothetical protein